LPRRLGDDPLVRAKAALAADSASVPQVAVQSSRSSYNDVFFQRRGEDADNAIASRVEQTRESPEITEISEIPEIREVAAAPAFQVDAAAASVEAKAAPEAAPVPAVVTIEKAEQVAPVVNAQSAPAQSEEKSGGFLKRLFGRFGK
jgi:hypothetical protein